MSSYFDSIYAAIITFLLLGFILFIPWLIFNYRKYGYISLWASIVAYSFIFYLLAALFLVLLPLPAVRDTCALQPADTVHYSLLPFRFIQDIANTGVVIWSKPATYVHMISQPAFMQAAFNFLLLLPLGVYLRYFFTQRSFWKKAFLIGLALSLFFEVTQITGIYGIYNCPYRIFDVDDLILNSTGALFGFFFAPILLALFPSRDQLLAKGKSLQKARPVAPLTQLVAITFDYLILTTSWTLVFRHFISDGFSEFIYMTFGFFVIYFIIPLLGNGKTIGSALMRFKSVQLTDESATWLAIFKRAFAIYLPFLLTYMVQAFTDVKVEMESIFYPYHVWLSLAALLFLIGLWAILFFHIVFVLMRKGKQSFYFDHVSKLKATKNQR